MSRSQSEEAALSGIKTQFSLFHSLHLLYKVSNRVNKHRKSLVVALDDFFFQANTPNVSSVEPLKCEIFYFSLKDMQKKHVGFILTDITIVISHDFSGNGIFFSFF